MMNDAPPSPALPNAPDGVPPLLQIAAFASLACVLTFVNRYLGLFVPLDRLPTWGAHALATLFLCAVLLVLMRLTRAAARLGVSSPTLIVLGIALAAPTLTVLFLQNARVAAPEWLTLAANSLFLPVGAALAGTAVGRIIKHPNTLLAAAGFALFFDCIVVTMGTVAAVAQSGSNIIALVSVGAGPSVPHTAQRTWAAVSAVTIGPADVLFLSVFFASVFLLRLDARRTFAYMFVLLAGALAVVEWQLLPAWLPGIPALLPMGIAVIAANARYGAFTDREKRDLFIGAAFAVFCAGIIVWRAQVYAGTLRAQQAAEAKKHIGFQLGYVPASRAHVLAAITPDSRAAQAGLRAGDVVLKINGEPIEVLARDETRFADVLKNAGRRGVTLTIKSGDQPAPRDVTFAPMP